MTEEVYQQIFDPFFTTKPVGSGTGLGLSISHQIVVEKHKGRISCISAPEKGTEFIVEIPVTCNKDVRHNRTESYWAASKFCKNTEMRSPMTVYRE